MKVLVTGSEGFLGRHVCAALRRRAYMEVIGLDSAPGADIVADITQGVPMVVGVDAIIHLAALANPRECDSNPVRAFNVNVQGTHQVLRAALTMGVKKVVFSSSAHVYDIPPKYLPTDECHPLRLNNTYTTTKLMGEQLCHLFYENHGLSYTTLRLYNAYGPGQALGYFVPDMITKAKTGLVVLEGHETTKDWIYVDDVAEAFCRAAESQFVGEINIGSGVETQLGAIAGVIAQNMGAKFTCNAWPNPTRMCADWGRAKRILGWEPTVDIWEGIRAVLAAESQPVPA